MGIEKRAPEEAVGCALAHSVKISGKVFRKGLILSHEVASELSGYALKSVTVLSPSSTGCHEDLAAERISERFSLVEVTSKKGIGGRINLLAESAGLFCFEVDKVHELNRVSESITIATLPDKTAVEPGQLVATLKIIPFFVAETDLVKALSVAEEVVLELRSWSTSARVTLIQTTLPSLLKKVYDKGLKIQTERLANYGLSLTQSHQIEHRVADLALLISDLSDSCDLMLILGANAICDRSDILPEAIKNSGESLITSACRLIQETSCYLGISVKQKLLDFLVARGHLR